MWSDCKKKMRVLLFSLAFLACLNVFHSAPGRAPPAVTTETLNRESDTITSFHEVNIYSTVTYGTILLKDVYTVCFRTLSGRGEASG